MKKELLSLFSLLFLAFVSGNAMESNEAGLTYSEQEQQGKLLTQQVQHNAQEEPKKYLICAAGLPGDPEPNWLRKFALTERERDTLPLLKVSYEDCPTDPTFGAEIPVDRVTFKTLLEHIKCQLNDRVPTKNGEDLKNCSEEELVTLCKAAHFLQNEYLFTQYCTALRYKLHNESLQSHFFDLPMEIEERIVDTSHLALTARHLLVNGYRAGDSQSWSSSYEAKYAMGIKNLIFDDQEKRLLLDDDGHVRLYDLESKTMQLVQERNYSTFDMAYSLYEKAFIAVEVGDFSNEDVALYNLDTKKRYLLNGYKRKSGREQRSIKISPKTNYLLLSCKDDKDGSILMWDLLNKEENPRKIQYAAKNVREWVAFNADETSYALLTSDGHIFFSGQEGNWAIPAPKDAQYVLFSSDEKNLIIIGSQITTIPLAKPCQTQSINIEGSKDILYRIAFDPTKSFFVTSDGNVIDIGTGKLLRKIPLGDKIVTALGFSPTGSTLVVAHKQKKMIRNYPNIGINFWQNSPKPGQFIIDTKQYGFSPEEMRCIYALAEAAKNDKVLNLNEHNDLRVGFDSLPIELKRAVIIKEQNTPQTPQGRVELSSLLMVIARVLSPI